MKTWDQFISDLEMLSTIGENRKSHNFNFPTGNKTMIIFKVSQTIVYWNVTFRIFSLGSFIVDTNLDVKATKNSETRFLKHRKDQIS